MLNETVWHLGNALLPALARPHEVSSIYAEHVMLAANTYFAETFGGLRPSEDRPGTLAPWQLRRVMDAMTSHAETDVSLKQLAADAGNPSAISYAPELAMAENMVGDDGLEPPTSSV